MVIKTSNVLHSLMLQKITPHCLENTESVFSFILQLHTAYLQIKTIPVLMKCLGCIVHAVETIFFLINVNNSTPVNEVQRLKKR